MRLYPSRLLDTRFVASTWGALVGVWRRLSPKARSVASISLALLLVSAARWLIHPVVGEAVQYTPLLAAVAVGAHQGGWRAGAVVTALSVLIGTELFVMPLYDFQVRWPVVAAQITFVASSALVVWVMTREAAARRRLRERDELLRGGYAERARLQRELDEARRMDSLGRLAGGVAHDFNNLLTVVLGSADMLRCQLPNSRELDNLILAATRATDVTKQLLGLGRRQMMVLRPTSIHDAIRESVQLCQRLLPANVSLTVAGQADGWLFEGDNVFLQQVLLNLITNARDAMPNGGTIRLEGENVVLDESFCIQHPQMTPGEYVRLGVVDCGTGMDAHTREHLFEPFFTAKERGTGLGLAVVYGLIKQLHGHIHVQTKRGEGTRFDIYFPRGKAGVEPPPEPRSEPATSGPRLRVLLVEDHPLVRAVLERMLRNLGHVTLVAEHGEAALQLVAQERPEVDVLVTDLVMPGIDGLELAERMRAQRPDLGVVLISGYSDNDALCRAVSGSDYAFLRKPFPADELESTLAAVSGLRPTRRSGRLRLASA